MRSLAAFSLTYVAAMLLSEHGYGALAVPSPFWLPDSVLLCALLLSPTRRWWIFVAAVWPIRWLTGAVPGTPAWFVLLSLANDTVKAIGAAAILRRLLGERIRLETLNEFFLFLGIAGAAVPLLSALGAAPARMALGDAVWPATYRWFLGDAVAQVIVTPMALYWWFSRGALDRRRELFVMLVVLAGTTFYAFVVPHEPHPLSLMYLPIPILVWAAVRLRPVGTASALTVVAVVGMIGAARGIGPFGADAIQQSTLTLQLFLLMSGVSLLSLAILIMERETFRQREAAFNNRLLDAQDHERARIAQELHDDIGQRMALLQIGLQRFRAATGLSAANQRQIDGFADSAAQISSGLRSLSHRLHPAVLDIVGLDLAMTSLCREFSDRHPVKVRYRSNNLPRHVDDGVNLCIYRVAQEALHNVVKHSGVDTAAVELSCVDGHLVLSVSDPGVGFHVDGVEDRSGLGLIGMRQRLRALGGNLTIQSAPGGGTHVQVEVPFQPEADSAIDSGAGV